MTSGEVHPVGTPCLRCQTCRHARRRTCASPILCANRSVWGARDMGLKACPGYEEDLGLTAPAPTLKEVRAKARPKPEPSGSGEPLPSPPMPRARHFTREELWMVSRMDCMATRLDMARDMISGAQVYAAEGDAGWDEMREAWRLLEVASAKIRVERGNATGESVGYYEAVIERNTK